MDRDSLIRQGLKLSQLRLLRAIGETGQVSAAAAQLAMSQPAASRMMADLERLTGVKLYERHPRGIMLTDAGRMLAARARRITQELEDAGHALSKLSSGVRGRVMFGAVTGPALEVVIPAIRQARLTHPEIELSVNVDTSDHLAEALVGGELDFYIGRLLGNIDASDVELREIGPEWIHLLVRADHPLLRRPQVTLDEALAYDWIMQPIGGLMRHTVELFLLHQGFELPARTISTASLLVTLSLVATTNAIAPVPRAVYDFYASQQGLGARLDYLPVDTEISVVPYSIITRRNDPLSASARLFLDIIEARLDAEGPDLRGWLSSE
ncbi:LysR family transcriptional regulator [Pelagovum pacificum]|nr:LysR family transcriptional regulator [Pelagovum pacificum]